MLYQNVESGCVTDVDENYNYVNSVCGTVGNGPYTQVTDPLGNATQYFFNTGDGGLVAPVISSQVSLTHKQYIVEVDAGFADMNSVVTPLGHRYRYEYAQLEMTNGPTGYDGFRQNVTSHEMIDGSWTPEGAETVYNFDQRQNTTFKQFTSKDGSTTFTINWVFPSTCANLITCNKPTAAIDANGNETDYTYDPVHGGVLTETGPADASGVRPQTRYTYTSMYPQVLNSSGALINAEAPIYKLTQTSRCSTATAGNLASCVGTAAETVTTYAYNSNNLLLTSVTVAAGDGSASSTTSYAYDNYGNRTMVDGPRTDVDDRSYATYDMLRRPVFEIGVDPDGSGPLPRAIVHHIYDVDGHEVRNETGTGNATDGSDFVVTSYKQLTYDSAGRLIQTLVGHP